MNSTIKSRFLLILFVFGLAIYSLVPSIKVLNLTDDKISQMSSEELNNLSSKALKLGLDLKGGIHIVLEVDLPQLTSNLARNKDSKFETFITELDKNYSIQDIDFFELFEEQVQKSDLKLQRYFSALGRTNDEIISQLSIESTDALNRIVQIIQNRIDQFGVSEPSIQKQGNSRVVIELAGIDNAERARDLLQSTALLELMIVKDVENTNSLIKQIDLTLDAINSTSSDDNIDNLFSGNDNLSSILSTIGSNLAIQVSKVEKLNNILNEEDVKQILRATNSTLLLSNSSIILSDDLEGEEYFLVYHLYNNAELSGGVIEDAQMRLSQSGVTAGQATVHIDMNGDGSREWARITGANINKRIAIVLDKKVHMAPVIRSQIYGGQTVIEGMSSIQEAEDIAIVLRAGALPVPVSIAEERTVGASLGADSVKQGRLSITFGLLIVVIFIVAYYRLSGIIASFAVLGTLTLLLGVLATLGATLTLPGIAGLILTVGMSIDANVIIFERIKEELRIGKSVKSAIDSGYAKALSTIVDANITTGIAAAILYQYGTGPIKGFATVLFWGIIVSMFTSIIVTRFIYDFIISRKNIRELSI
jgi:preprotein translocase subunit SecD